MVNIVDHRPVIRLGPVQTAYPMRRFDRDVFLYQPVGENAFGESAVTFAVGPDERAASVVIANLALSRHGTFTRVHSRSPERPAVRSNRAGDIPIVRVSGESRCPAGLQ